jgi:hypothetical protein
VENSEDDYSTQATAEHRTDPKYGSMPSRLDRLEFGEWDLKTGTYQKIELGTMLATLDE